MKVGRPHTRDTLLVNIDPTLKGGALIHGDFKLFVGGPFPGGIWQMPPEVGAHLGVPAEQAVRVGKDIECPSGCLVNLRQDPQEKQPFYYSGDPALLKKLMAMFAVYSASMAPALYLTTKKYDMRAIKVWKAHNATMWPWL